MKHLCRACLRWTDRFVPRGLNQFGGGLRLMSAFQPFFANPIFRQAQSDGKATSAGLLRRRLSWPCWPRVERPPPSLRRSVTAFVR